LGDVCSRSNQRFKHLGVVVPIRWLLIDREVHGRIQDRSTPGVLDFQRSAASQQQLHDVDAHISRRPVQGRHAVVVLRRRIHPLLEQEFNYGGAPER
jgi:hypothetical protein